jgi:hypothetical protein
MRVCLVVALLFGLMAAPATADTEPLPAGTTVVPRDGQVWTASAPQDLVVYASDYDDLPDAFAFAVATSPATGPDGLLADPVARYTAPAELGHPGIYAARISLAAPGTYYWQATYADEDEEDDVYASDVRAVTVMPQPPPETPTTPVTVSPAPAAPLPVATPRPPDAATVRIAIRRAIHAATHMLPQRLVYRCRDVTCRPSWRDFRNRYRGTLELTFGPAAVTARFAGTRVPRRHGRARAVSWTTTV